ncbi:MAG: hypothetical protein ACK5PF_08875 [bacterium]
MDRGGAVRFLASLIAGLLTLAICAVPFIVIGLFLFGLFLRHS